VPMKTIPPFIKGDTGGFFFFNRMTIDASRYEQRNRITIDDKNRDFSPVKFEAKLSTPDFFLATCYSLLATSIIWDGTDDYGHKLPPGIYFIRLENYDFKRAEKAILLR